MRIEILGGLLRNIGNFSMHGYKNRLILQKTVYFLKVFGVDLGYDFNWYIAGPYSPDLADDGFKLQVIYNKIKKAEFIDLKMKSKFNNVINFISKIKSDAHRLELLASIHFLKKLKIDDANIIKIVENKVVNFTKEEILKETDYLQKEGLI